MIKIGEKSYFIDFDAIEKLVTGSEDFQAGEVTEKELIKNYNEIGAMTSFSEVEKTFHKDRQYDASKYDILVMMLQVVMSNQDEIDEGLGFERGLAKQPIPFKIAFNTLLYYKVLRNLDL
jgi:hypothetical protein